MHLRDFRLLSAPVTLAAPVSLVPKGTVRVPLRRRHITVAGQLLGAKPVW